MALLPTQKHIQAFFDPFTWRDNPFLAREARRDAKRLYPFITFCWMCGLICLVGSFAYIGKVVSEAITQNDAAFMGLDVGTGVCVLVSGIQIWFVAGAAQKHTSKMLTMEANQNTLHGLLTLPLTTFQLMLQVMVYPWLAAMRLVAVMLPVYVFCIGMDGITWGDLLMLYVVFALTALSVPIWSRPALSEQVEIVAPPSRFMGSPLMKLINAIRGKSGAGVSLSGRWLSFGFLLPIIITITSLILKTSAEGIYAKLYTYLPQSIVSLFPMSYIAWPLIMARALITPFDWFGFGLIPLPFVLLMVILVRYSQLVKASEYMSIGSYRDLPNQPTFRARRNLEAATRILGIFLLTGYLWKWAVLDGGLAFLGPTTAGSSPGQIGFAILIFVLAYIMSILRGAQVGLWMRTNEGRGKAYAPNGREEGRGVGLKSGLRYVCLPYAVAICFYLLCCLFAQTNPFPTLLHSPGVSLLSILSQMILIGFGGTLLSLGISRLFGSLGIAIRIVFILLIICGIAYAQDSTIRQWLSSVPQFNGVVQILPRINQMEILSPAAGILHLAAPEWMKLSQWLPIHQMWWKWPLTDGLVGLLLWGCSILGVRSWAFGVRSQNRNTSPTLIMGESTPTTNETPRTGTTLHPTPYSLHPTPYTLQPTTYTLQPTPYMLDPTIMGQEPMGDKQADNKNPTLKQDTPIARKVIEIVQKISDNPVVTKELRVRLRGKLETSFVIVSVILFLLFTIMLCLPYISDITKAIGGGIAFLLFGDLSAKPAAVLGGSVLGIWYLVLVVCAPCFGVVTSSAFYPETQKSTLGFMLATPMKNSTILVGKMMGMLIPMGLFLLAIGAWTLLLSLILTPLIGFLSIVGWLVVMLTAFTACGLVSTLTLAVSSLFPRMSMHAAGWIWLLLIYFAGGPLIIAYALLSFMLAAIGFQGYGPWLAFILVGIVVILLTFIIGLGGITTMRRKDTTFSMTKQGS